MKTLQLNPHTALPGRTKELVGLGVAAQIPCKYCIYAHTEFAKLNGASDAEVGEAVAMAALTAALEHVPERHPDRRDEVPRRDRQGRRQRQEGERVEGAGAGAGRRGGRRSALKEATQMLGGYVPEFIRDFPERGARRRLEGVPRRAAVADDGALGQAEGAGRPGGRCADSLPVLHHRAHRVRQAERRHRRRDQGSDRDGVADPRAQHAC